MSLFDLLAKTGDKVKGLGNNLYNRIRNTEVQPITLNQLSEDGGVDIDATMRVLDQTTPLTLGERFTGRTLTKDFQKIDPKTGKAEMTTVTSVRPGLLNDISAGYQENRFNPVSIENLKQNTLNNGREKGFAYRLGEGLGSLARLGNSPLGRGLLVGGIVGASGGNGLEALTYGAGTTMLNQGNVLKDQLYRRELEKYGFDTSGIKGYISDDTFNKYLQSKQMQDNAAYRNALLKTQTENQKEMMEWRKQEAQRQARQDVANNYFKNKQIGIQEKSLDLQAEKLKGKGNNNLQNLQAVSNQLQRFEDSFKNMPGKLESNTLGRLRNATGLQTKEEANFNSQRTLLFNKIARDLGGEKGVLSDQDIKRIEKSLPDYTDSMVQKQAKMQAIYDLLNDRLSVEGVQGFSQESDPLGIL